MRKLDRRWLLKTAGAGIAVGALAPGVLLAQVAGPAAGPLKILEFNDMHIKDGTATTYPRKVIAALNAEGGDLVLACGDLAQDGTKTELTRAKALCDQLKMPYYPVVGNHDCLHSGGKPETLYKEIMAVKETNCHFRKKGIHFVGIDHGNGKNARDRAVRPATLAWLKKTLAGIDDAEPIIFFSHYPFGKGVKYCTQNASVVLAMFKGKRLLAVIGGHFHGNTLRKVRGAVITTTACSSGWRGNHDRTPDKGYRIIRVAKDLSIKTEFKVVT